MAKISRRAIASEWREPAQSVERSDDHDIETETKVISSADVHGFRGDLNGSIVWSLCAELQKILDNHKAISPEYRIEKLHRLQKVITTAQALVEENGDKGLREIVASIAAQVASSKTDEA